MPFINFCTNIDVSAQQECELRKQLGQIISIIPGKSEQWLMIKLEDNAKLSLAGDSSLPAAMVSLKAFGSFQSNNCYDDLTKAVTATAEKLGIPADRVYVEYEVTQQWGWNGKNFGR